jgi:hypothetical protein
MKRDSFFIAVTNKQKSPRKKSQFSLSLSLSLLDDGGGKTRHWWDLEQSDHDEKDAVCVDAQDCPYKRSSNPIAKGRKTSLQQHSQKCQLEIGDSMVVLVAAK